MRSVLASALAVVLVATGSPLVTATAATQQTGSIAGVARDAQQKPLPNTIVRLRDTQNGQLVGDTKTNESGEYTFTGLEPGCYTIEVVDAAGNIIGSSTAICVASGAAVTDVAIVASAAGAAAAAAAAGGLGAFFASTAGIVTLAAIGGGITTAVVTTRPEASPSR